MNKIKLLMPIASIPVLGMSIAPLASCNCGGQNETTITLSVKQLQLGVNETKQIQAKVSPAGSTITWKSNDKSIATVDKGGNVTGVAVGSTTVIAAANGATAKCSVTVAATGLTSIEITSQPTLANYIHGDKLDLTGLEVTGHYDNGTSKVLDKSEYTTLPAEGDEMKISDDAKTTEQRQITISCGSLTAQTNSVTVSAIVAPLEFTANYDFTLSLSDGKQWNGTLEYSTDGNNFNVWDGASIQTTNRKLYLKGTNNNYFCPDYSHKTTFVFSSEDDNLRVSCGDSDIRSLLNYSDVRKIRLSNYGFAQLFYECSALVSAPKLTLTTICDQAYRKMFGECPNLFTCDTISATKHWENKGTSSEPDWQEIDGLPKQCCDAMFNHCSSLMVTPKLLPATTLGEQCYGNMFAGCGLLQNPPSLPAMNLASGCYLNMFLNCYNMKTPPELPATTLAEGCYSGMFLNCTNLTSTPKLPATNLANNCYYNMFGHCESLTKAPELPAVTLAESCYAGMFQSCTNLTSAPSLLATTLARYCYQYMFANCSNLKISETGDDDHKIFTCPDFEIIDDPVGDMFSYTKDKEEETYTPEPGTSYYWVEE